MKKIFLALALSVIMLLLMTACEDISTGIDNTQSPRPSAEESLPTSTPIPTDPIVQDEDVNTIQSGKYTLPCGMGIQFSDSVRNDVTGNWRRAATSDSYVPAEHALEYYNEMFSSDDEIHSVWNATLGTTTRLSVAFGILYVDTFEYVNGEEHDANLMFSGKLLDSKMIDLETGEEIEE